MLYAQKTIAKDKLKIFLTLNKIDIIQSQSLRMYT